MFMYLENHTFFYIYLDAIDSNLNGACEMSFHCVIITHFWRASPIYQVWFSQALILVRRLACSCDIKFVRNLLCFLSAYT